MMILRAGYSNRIDSDYSIFISFNFNRAWVDIIKSLPNRVWDDTTKEWEVPYGHYTLLITTLRNYGIPFDEDLFMSSIKQLQYEVEEMTKLQSFDAHVDASILDNVQFKTDPYPYQREGIAYGLTHDKFLLADEQGLGKTYQTLNIAILKHGGKHCLIIAGYDTLQFNWVNEVKKHTNENAYVLGQRKKKDGRIYLGTLKDRWEDIQNLDKIEEFFIITAPTTIRQCIKQEYVNKQGKTKTNKLFHYAQALEEWCRRAEIGRIIIDEGQVFRNYDSSQTQALLKIKSCPYKIVVTGTPIMNKNLDLYPIMVWMDQEKKNFWEYRDRYCKMGGFKNKQVVDNKNTPELHKKLSTCMLRRLKSDVLNLPDKIFIDELLEMDGKQWSLYEKTKMFYKQKLAQMRGNKVELLASVLNMRKITCHPKWVDDEYKDSVKFERVLQLMNDINENNQKALLFSNWSTPIDWLQEELKMYNPAVITGDTKDRMAQVDKFQNDDSCKIILGTIGAMGTGLTLTAASNVIFIDEPWNRALKDQAVDRCHRIGTKNNINVYTLLCNNTMDLMVHGVINKKGRLADQIVDGVTVEELEQMLQS